MKQSAIIIGGGIGGLFTGAFLSRNGVDVTVLEKNHIIGGGLQCFHRNNKIFETGMHVMGGFEAGGILSKICRYLGILDNLKIHHIDPECMDEIRYEKTGEVFRIPSGKESFISKMSEYFPHESRGVKEYVDKIYELTEEENLFYLREDDKGTVTHSEEFSWSTDKLISHYIKDEKLQELLAYLNSFYGGIKGHTPAYVHALINVLYIEGASRFIDGSQQLADALAGVITANEGRVLSDSEVTKVEIKDRNIISVQTDSGESFKGDWYISSVHPSELLRILPDGAFLKAYTSRLKEIPVSCSAFSVYIDLKPDRFPYIDHTCYYMEEFGSIWNQDKFDAEDWPRNFMYMTPPDSDQGKYATRLLVHCIMSYDQVRQWENTTTGHRGKDYEAWKKRCCDMVIRKLENVYQGFSDMVENVYASSPLTIRDFYNTKEGAIFGNRKDSENLMLSQLSVFTKVRNLLLTGQNVNLHGICGVPLTAINTAEAILGENTLIKQINDDAGNN